MCILKCNFNAVECEKDLIKEDFLTASLLKSIETMFLNSPRAYFARVRPLARVNPHVHCQLGSLVELGAALVALVGLVLLVRGVGPHVVLDVTLE